MNAAHPDHSAEGTGLPEFEESVQPAPIAPEVSGAPDLPAVPDLETAPENLGQQLGAQPPEDTDGGPWP